MKHSVSHSLGKEMACKVARKAFDSYVARFSEYNARANWKNDTSAEIGFSVKGASLAGQVEVKDNSIDVDMTVPFLLKPFQKMAVGKIEEEIQSWIGKAKAGELD